MTSIAFVAPRRRNAFFGEMASALCDELAGLGVAADPDGGRFDGDDGETAFVLFPPHELISQVEDASELPSSAQLGRSVFICAEQPGSPFFDANARVARLAGAAFDLNLRGARAYRELGLEVDHLPLGYTKRWDRFDPDRERPIEVAFLGCHTQRRMEILARCARTLAGRRTELVVSDNSRPNLASGADFVAGDEKLDLLASTALLLNLHRSEERYFEWARVLEAIHCGAVVLSEWSTDFEPLEPGEHFLSARPEAIPTVLERALEDQSLLDRVRRDAHAAIRERLPLRASAELLAEAAERALARGRPTRLPRPRRWIRRSGRLVANPHLRALAGHYRARSRASRRGRRLKRERIAEIDVRRARALAELGAGSGNGAGPPGPRQVLETAAWREGEPSRVSVIVPVHDHAAEVVQALGSLDRSHFRDFELIAVDDGSADGSLEAIADLVVPRGTRLPALLLQHPVNRGLPASRNAGIAAARGELLLFLDADNELYPACLDRLVEALDSDPGASFAYGMLEAFDHRGPQALIGYWGWDPERLRERNYIDALALVRASVLAEEGGFREDPRIYGWEDYELWCRLAESGHRAAHVRGVVARYRVSDDSMISTTNLYARDAEAAIAELHPQLFAPKPAP